MIRIAIAEREAQLAAQNIADTVSKGNEHWFSSDSFLCTNESGKSR
ncbi:MAG: hypothetical protein LIP11_18565 [Clostridiales bacterium]|nr:hypothetical protein [Clostridiales bacterium]